VENAVALAVILSKTEDYTETPLNIQIDEGIHEIRGNHLVNVACSHITFIGKGAERTTINGGFHILDQHGVAFEDLTIKNIHGRGLFLEGGVTNVDVVKCSVKESPDVGVQVSAEATMTATQCEFMNNGGTGVLCSGACTTVELHGCTMYQNRVGLESQEDAVVDLYGTKTDIHSNKLCGVAVERSGLVCIHLPFDHNTVYGNGELGDFLQNTHGRIARIHGFSEV